LLFEHFPCDLGDAPGDDGDGGVWLLAAGSLAFEMFAEVAVATDDHPGSLDEGPSQPFVALVDHAALIEVSGGTMRGGGQSAVADETGFGFEAFDAVDLAGEHPAEARNAAQQLGKAHGVHLVVLELGVADDAHLVLRQ